MLKESIIGKLTAVEYNSLSTIVGNEQTASSLATAFFRSLFLSGNSVLRTVVGKLDDS